MKKIINKLFKFDSDASIMEKVVTVLGAAIPAVLIAYLYLSAFQVFHNDYQKFVAAASPKVVTFGLGFIFTGAWVYYLIGLTTDKYTYKAFSFVFIGLMMVLAITAFAGFNFDYFNITK